MASFSAVLWLFQELDVDLADTPLHGNTREDGTLLLSCASSSRHAEIKKVVQLIPFTTVKWVNGEMWKRRQMNLHLPSTIAKLILHV